MTPRLVFGLILAAAVATPAGWPSMPFKKSKDKPATEAAAPLKAESKKDDAKREGFDSLYAGGTVAAIPQNSMGKLDLSDRAALRFHYGKPTWSVPYSKVTSIAVADRKQPKMLHVPKLMKDKRVFTIGFSNENGQKQNLIIEMPVQTALSALPLLEERTGKAAVVEGAQNPDGWWGDRYWRTTRNSGTWDEVNGQTKTTVAQAKE